MSKYFRSFYNCSKECDVAKCQSTAGSVEIGVCVGAKGAVGSNKFTVEAGHLITFIWDEKDNKTCKGAATSVEDSGPINTCIPYPGSYRINIVTETPSAINSIDKMN